METKTIYVSLKGGSGKLWLRDSDNNEAEEDIITKVNINDVVEWVVDKDLRPGTKPIHSIVKVYKKEDDDPENVWLLIADPIERSDGVWEGKVVPRSPGKDKKQKYNIDFKRFAEDENQTCDPKLQMN